jgi:hypothetical protein
MKKLLAVAIITVILASHAYAASLFFFRVGQADGSGGGGGGGVVACPQTGLDFSNPCNLIYQPALMH